MWNKKQQPEQPPPLSEEERSMAQQCGDTGGPVSEIDPEEIIAHEENAAEEIARLRAEAEEWKGKYTRSLADFQNYQRRASENEKEARRQGITGVVTHLMGVIDNFDLALRQDAEAASVRQILEGVTIIRDQLMHALGAVGVRPLEPAPGDEFDPHRHEAVAHVPDEGVEPGRVSACFQCGFTLGERVLRPAKVAVARAPDQQHGQGH